MCDVRRTCTACRSAKVKCDRQSPVCGRCARLELPCVEQVRKQGRPSASMGGVAFGGGAGPGGFGHPGAAGGGLSEGGGQLINDFILQTFQKLLQAQTVDQDKTLKILQVTNLMSTAFKADFLGGLGSKLQFFLRTSVAALKDTEDVLAEMTQLEEQLDVRWRDGNISFGGVHPSLQALDDRVSLVACVTSVLGGPMRVICNHHFSELVCTAKDFYQRMESESISPFIIWAKLVASEDRLDFLEALTKFCFGQSEETELAQIVKMKSRNEAAFLAVVRVRMVLLGNGRYMSIIFNASPAPSSKYLRGGNREPDPSSATPSTSALGFPAQLTDASFRFREPSPRLQDLRADFAHANTGDERVLTLLRTLQAPDNPLLPPLHPSPAAHQHGPISMDTQPQPVLPPTPPLEQHGLMDPPQQHQPDLGSSFEDTQSSGDLHSHTTHSSAEAREAGGLEQQLSDTMTLHSTLSSDPLPGDTAKDTCLNPFTVADGKGALDSSTDHFGLPEAVHEARNEEVYTDSSNPNLQL